jgi:hypothetical protein
MMMNHSFASLLRYEPAVRTLDREVRYLRGAVANMISHLAIKTPSLYQELLEPLNSVGGLALGSEDRPSTGVPAEAVMASRTAEEIVEPNCSRT